MRRRSGWAAIWLLLVAPDLVLGHGGRSTDTGGVGAWLADLDRGSDTSASDLGNSSDDETLSGGTSAGQGRGNGSGSVSAAPPDASAPRGQDAGANQSGREQGIEVPANQSQGGRGVGSPVAEGGGVRGDGNPAGQEGGGRGSEAPARGNGGDRGDVNPADPVDPENPGNQTDRDAGSIAEGMQVNVNSAADLNALISGLILNTAACLLCLMILMIFCRWFPKTYSHNVLLGKAPAFSPNLCSWARASLCSTEEAIEVAGLDSAMVLELCNLCMYISLIFAVPLVAVMCPLHYYMGDDLQGKDRLSTIDMGNILDGSKLYYVHAGIVWMVCLVIRFSVYRAQAKFLRLRFNWLKKLPYPRSNTILIENLPKDYRSDERLRWFFSKTFSPNAVKNAHVVKCAEVLSKSIKQRQDFAYKRYREELRLKKHGVRPRCRPHWCGDEVDSIDHYDEKLREVEAVIGPEREKLLQQIQGGRDLQTVNSHAAFVTFRCRQEAEMARDLHYGADKHTWQVSEPPEASTIRWGDLVTDPWLRTGRSLIGYAMVLAVYIFFMPMCTLITSLTAIVELPGQWQAIWDSIAPSFGLQFMLAWLPTILLLILRLFFTLKSDSEAQHQLQIWYFIFQLVFVVLVTAVGNSLIDSFKAISEEPITIFSQLAQHLPSATHFYMNYLVLQCTTHATAALRMANLCKYWFYRTLHPAEEARELSEPEDQDYYGLGSRYSRFAISMVICIVFSTLSPLVALLSFLHFAWARLIYGYLIICAETRKPDLGGEFWVTAMKHLIAGTVLYCALMIGVFAARAPVGAWILAAPSLIYMVWTYNHFCTAFHWERLPFEEVVTMAADVTEAPTEVVADQEDYVQPELIDDQRGKNRLCSVERVAGCDNECLEGTRSI